MDDRPMNNRPMNDGDEAANQNHPAASRLLPMDVFGENSDEAGSDEENSAVGITSLDGSDRNSIYRHSIDFDSTDSAAQAESFGASDIPDANENQCDVPLTTDNRGSSGSGAPLAEREAERETAHEVNRWHEERHAETKRQGERWSFLIGLPSLNQWLLGSGTGLIALALLRLAVPPVYSTAADALHPYTVLGRQETCQTHLQQLGMALALYTKDNDGHFPPLDNGVSGTARSTWVTALQGQAGIENFRCPEKSVSDERTLSAYGFNPILAGGTGSAKQNDIAGPADTVLIADRAEEHDLALLPPLAGWSPDAAHADATYPNAAHQKAGNNVSNIAFRHSGNAVFLYADGHASAGVPGEWLKTNSPWGGALAMRHSMAHLGTLYPILQQVQAALDKGDDRQALALLKYNRLKARDALGQVFHLWRQNGGGNDDNGSLTVEKWGWRLGQLWRDSGESGVLAEMNREQTARSAAILQAVNAGAWQKHESDLGFSIEYTADWTVETQTEGRYTSTYFRSSSPYITVLVEKGKRDKPGPESGVDWEGMDRNYRKTYGKGYKRIRMGTAMLGGETASLWEFELEREGEPSLRKLYIGRSHTWNSYVVAATAPVDVFESWKPPFKRILESFQ